MKIKFNSDDELPLNKTIKIQLMLIKQVHQKKVIFATIGIS